jgi:cyclase
MISSASLVLVLALGAPEYGKTTAVPLGDGLTLFTTTPYGDVGFCGNVVAISSPEGTLLFDSGATPGTARTILGELKGPPVRWLVNSHWHWDHWAGNQAVVSAFPSVAVITSRKTLQQMKTVEPRWNKYALSRDLPGYLAQVKDPAKRAVAQSFLEEKRSVRPTYPTVTFDDAVTIWVGGREVQLLRAPGVTTGDTVAYLPRERVLIAGDLLRDPYPFPYGGTFPRQWLASLERLAALDPKIIIPGHGQPLEGTALLKQTITLFRQVLADVEQGKAGAPPGVAASPELNSFLEIFVRRAVKERSGDLGDLPDGLPD